MEGVVRVMVGCSSAVTPLLSLLLLFFLSELLGVYLRPVPEPSVLTQSGADTSLLSSASSHSCLTFHTCSSFTHTC